MDFVCDCSSTYNFDSLLNLRLLLRPRSYYRNCKTTENGIMETISKSVYSNDYCCGCSVCTMSCPQKAISMRKDDKGFYHAIVSAEACINCGKCQKVCIYSSSRDFETLDTCKV